MFKMVGICWHIQVYIVRQQWQKLGNSPITHPRNITGTVLVAMWLHVLHCLLGE